MSDYGDDYSDYGDDFFYVEDEYMAADDLAEHAVASPPPMACGDDDMLPDWDRFDYFNDLEYASDGYDDATFQPHDVKDAKTGDKRKRAARKSHSMKRIAKETLGTHPTPTAPGHSPIVWRTHADRAPKPRLLEDNAQSYALLKNWREKLANTPEWARGSPLASPSTRPSHYEQENVSDEEQGIPEDVLLAALQRQIAAAGIPITGMDPKQLLEFAMRMATDKDAGDAIAGEMAEAMLGGEDEEDDAGAEENLLSWVAQQRNSLPSKRPPTSPSPEANRSARVSTTTTKPDETNTNTASLKRRADDHVDSEASEKVVKKRVTRSFNAPTAASQPRAAPAKATRATRGKKP
ncbi:hypothetical protein EJ02DRAFT_421338 [Clathrospora elynae]|uniref:Uncharacterized protein n=1 Tax=Clathrospora elynae TaxID=706981 RepID=A0A6A5SVH8_9PLEO|nr:hypothetical protein EJ02DRAFT_421338 [Clathrospora elynae]